MIPLATPAVTVTGGAAGLRWVWRPGGNVESLAEGERPVVVAGVLHGALRAAALRPGATPRELGEAAMASNGSFAVIASRGAGVLVVSDAGGSIPVFAGHGPRGFAVGVYAHQVALGAGLTEVDLVSVADFLRHGSVCAPYSWYEGVRLLPPGSVAIVSAEGVRATTYWEPEEPGDVCAAHRDVEAWGEALRAETARAVAQGVEGRRRVRVLFSGGEDSRAIAGVLPADLEVRLTTVLDGRNREYRLAAAAARALGRDLELVQRPPGFLQATLAERVAIAGQGMDPADVHIAGDVARRFADAGVLLGGHMADGLFKTAVLGNVRHARFLPEALTPPRPDLVMGLEEGLPMESLRPGIAAGVRERRQEHHRRLLAVRPLTAGNWHVLWPIGSHSKCYGHRMSHLAVGPRTVEPFLTHRTYMLAARMPDACRMEREAFRRAFAPGLGRAAWVSATGGKRLALGPHAGAAVGRATLIVRHRWDQVRGRVGREGPWSPPPATLAASGFVTPEQEDWCREVLGGVLRRGAGAQLDADGASPAARLRALTLGFTATDVERLTEAGR
jgi:hypothetical protein